MTLSINAPEALVQQDFSAILTTIASAVRPLVGQGKVADYIPILAQVPAARFGMALATVDGRVFEAGDAGQPSSIQSISKEFIQTMALEEAGAVQRSEVLRVGQVCVRKCSAWWSPYQLKKNQNTRNVKT